MRRLWGHRLLVVSLALWLVSLLSTLRASVLTGPSFTELGRLAATRDASRVVWELAEHGLVVVRSSAAREIYEALAPYGAMPALLGGWARLSLGRLGMLDLLTCSRLPWLVICSLAPVFLFLCVERLASWELGVLSALVLLVLPGWVHASAVASDAAIAASCWLAVLSAGLRSLRAARSSGAHGRRTALGWAVVAAALFGVTLGMTLAVLWVVPWLALHFWLSEPRSSWASPRRAELPLPGVFVVALIVSPIALLATNPLLWGAAPLTVVSWLLDGLRPQVRAVLYLGERGADPHWAWGYGPLRVLLGLPAGALLALVVGLLSPLWQRWRRGPVVKPSATGAESRRSALSFALVGLLFTLAVPALVGGGLRTFPPRCEAALPWLAVMIAAGAAGVVALLPPGRLGPAMLGVVLALLGWVGFSDTATASAAFGLQAGGERGIARSSAFELGDGSELAVLAPLLADYATRGVPVTADGVPAAWGVALAERDATAAGLVLEDAPPAQAALVRGGCGDVGREVRRGGVALWCLREP